MATLLDRLWAVPDRNASRAKVTGNGRDDRQLHNTMPSGSSSPTMSFTHPPGATPLPRYTIRRGIGIGGFGEVYFAVSDAGKEVALKRVQRNLEVELRGVSQCLNLKHPHLVALHDVCYDTSGQAWVVMEYIAGPNLREVLDDSPQGLAESEVRRWFAGIGSAVAHLHASGLVHRDLKPGNVFDDLGIVKVGDYGLSKFISASHRGGHTESVGTFHYMAPEIGRGEYGREIDIYALGIVLYELLTGRVPFDGESCHEIIVKHLTSKPDLSGLREPYRTAIARALEKDPRQRPKSVDELFQILGMPTPGFSVVTSAAPHAPVDDPTNKTPVRSSSVGRETAETAAVEYDTEDEPFARAIRNSFADLGRWWSSLDRSPGIKAFLAIVAAVVLAVNTRWLLPLLSVVGLVYVPYYIIRQMLLHAGQQPSYAAAQRVASVQRVPRKPINRGQWRRWMRGELRAKPSLDRFAELITSWVASTLTVLLLAFVSGVIGLRNGPIDAVAVAPYAWIAVVVMIASCGLLGLGKLWEREDGEALPRRVVLAGVGAGVGLVAYFVQQFLLLPGDLGLPYADSFSLPNTLYDGEIPRASAWMAHFAALFAALRWWKPLDPLRRTRLSLWSVAVAVVAEWLLHQVLPIPQPAGMLMAGGIAITIQMSAPWTSPSVAPIPTPGHTNATARSVA